MSYIGNEPIVSATRTVTEITATAGQTTFTANGGYTVGYIDVFVNGAQLQTSDFTATNGSSVTLNAAAIAGDDVRLVAWGTFGIVGNQTIEFADGSASAPSITNAGDNNTGIFFPAADTIAFAEGGTESMRLDSSGNVGIGTSSPSTYGGKLAVFDAGGNGILAVGQGTSYSQIQSNGFDLYVNQNVSGAGSNAGSTIFRRGGSQTESMRIDSSGNVGIGTSSPSYKLQTNGTTAAASSLWLGRSGTAPGSGNAFNAVYFGNGNNGSDRSIRIEAYQDGAFQDVIGMRFFTQATDSGGTLERMRITSSGQLRTTVTGTTIMDDYGCRAWVNFNGTGTVAIRASGNVSSITDRGTGEYTVNFSSAMPDANYTPVVTSGYIVGTSGSVVATIVTDPGGEPTASAFRFVTRNSGNGALGDSNYALAAVFR